MNTNEVAWWTTRLRGKSLPVLAIVLLYLQIGFAQFALAIGVGATDVRSSLGENLRIVIPIFSVDNPDSLIVSATTSMYDNDPSRQLSVSLDRSNSQLSIVVYTDWPMVEPYVQFNLSLQDGSVVQQKDVVVLLEYKPEVSITDPLRSQAPQPVVQISRAPQITRSANAPPPKMFDNANTGGIMGPYDTAQPGQIPEKFGAVLDGQSLWRVARRINGAMGVSVEQMMVALHEANPQAFFNDSVDSLAAGSYLTIPSSEFVKRLSHNQAKERLGLSSNVSASLVVSEPADSSAASAAVNNTVPIEAEEIKASESPELDANIEPPIQSDSFMIGTDDVVPEEGLESLTSDAAIASVNDGSATGVGADFEVIQTLSKTVGVLMRDNIDREQRIQILEARLAAVETTLDGVDFSGTDTNPTPGAQGVESSLAARTDQSNNQSNRWIWPSLFGLLLVLGLFLRRYLGGKNRVTNIFSSLETDAADKIVAARSAQLDSSGKGLDEKKSKTDYSTLESNKTQRSYQEEEDEDEIEGVSYHEFDDGLMVDDEDDSIEPTSVTTVDTPSVTLDAPNKSFLFEAGNVKVFPRESDLTPQKKNEIIRDLDELIAEERFDEVRDLLDMFRGKQLDEANYHFQRLRLLLEEDDEHGFYEYFNMVENKFQDVDGDLKMDLANLVSRLNQN